MDSDKVREFMQLAGQQLPDEFVKGDPRLRELGARLLLTEVLEYVIHGLGVIPEVNGEPITEPDDIVLRDSASESDHLEMLDGLADVAYTMYWNALAFGLRLEEAYTLVCDNNLEKFVLLEQCSFEEGELIRENWDCGRSVVWPAEVVRVDVVRVGEHFYAAGKDQNGKVRKPSSYKPVDLKPLLAA